MQDTDSTISSPGQTALKEESFAAAPPVAKKRARAAFPAPGEAKPQGLMASLWGLVKRLFARKPVAYQNYTPELTDNDRAAAARAAQMPPPVVFKGDTASTLVTPMGTYAGKPLDLVMRKRAEQQFKTMDVTQVTMN